DPRAQTNTAPDPDITAMLLYNTIAGGQSETGAPSWLLSGIERLEEMRLHHGVHARAGGAHGQENQAPREQPRVLLSIGLFKRNVGGLDRQLASMRHGIAGIDGEIHKHLLNL